MNERDLSKIPAGACVLNVGELEIGDNGEKAKTAPVRLVARTGKPVEHWFWGRVVHDLAGMRLHKPRIPIDYVHDAKEIIGYLNRFDTETGDLIVSGALIPFKDSDRATEIIHKNRAGVPYEASINFGGDGIKVEELADGQCAQVNGYQFDGPGTIVREWPLRGVAICPYGADANTASAVLRDSNQLFSASVVTAPEATTKEPAVKEKSKPVEVAALAAAPGAEVVVEVKPAAVEAKPAEAIAIEVAPAAAVEPVAVEAKPSEAKVEEKPEVKKELSRDEFSRIADRFGDAVAAKVMRDGGDYAAALELAFDSQKTEIKTLRDQIAETNKQQVGSPVAMTNAKPTSKLFNTGK